MALGRGYALPFIAGKQGGGGAGGEYGLLWQQAINANVPPLTAEDFNSGQGSCLFTRGKSLYDAVETKPSLLIVPQIRGAGKLAVDIQSPVYFDVTRATTATRVNSSGLIESVASGVPRLDWYATPAAQDAAATGCPALLVEASGQNLALQSTFSTGWSTSFSGSVSGNASGTNSPEGSGNAALLSVVTTAFSSIWRTITTVSGSVYTASVFAKKRDKDFLYFVNLAGNTAVAWFNLASGTVGTVGANTTARIENYGNGWYRCSITQTAGGTTSYIQFGLSDANNTNAAASSGSNFVFGAQFELGSVATTYIPTTSGAVSRSADVISASGALVSGLIGQTEGTIYAEVDLRSFANLGMIASISDGTASNRLEIYKFTDSKIRFDRTSATQSALTAAASTATYTAPTILKIAVGYMSGDTIMYINGVAATTQQTPTFTFGALTQVNIGSNRNNGQLFTDRIRAAALYTTRLSNDQLAELTRL